ncbi:LPS export ABC transporter periplasmic protein LptC [Gammaproteobacteria bacterium]|nr:LPS export ABC transporter periplasmic protein LptC [Gammaproteobacteria bacterium]
MNQKNQVGIIVLTSFALLTWLWSRQNPISESNEMQNLPGLIGYYLKDAEITGTDSEGNPLYWIKAASAEEQPDNNHLILKNITAQYNSSNNVPWVLKASHGEVSNSTSYLNLSGDVQLTTENKEGIGPTTIQTIELRLEPESFIAETNAPVSVLIGSHRLEAVGFRADLRTNQLSLKSNVYGQFSP